MTVGNVESNKLADAQPKKWSLSTKLEFYVLFTLVQIIGIVNIVLVIVWTNKYKGGYGWKSTPNLEFNWHFLLMTLAFVYLYGNSNMIYRSIRIENKYPVKLAHAFIHTTVFSCVIVATYSVFDSRDLKSPDVPHLYSLHSWIGIATVSLYGLMWLAGLCVFLLPVTPIRIRALFKPFHVYFGLCLFVMAVGTAASGFLEKAIFDTKMNGYRYLPENAVMMNVIGTLFVLFGIIVVYLVTQPKFIKARA